jgi:hypothetical protein
VFDLSGIAGELDRLLEIAQREAERARDAWHDPAREAVGTALDGRVSARMAPDGRLSELILADDVLSLRAVDLAREITAAVNRAWAATRSADPVAGAAAVVDPAALADAVKQVKDEGMITMRRVTDLLAEQMRKIDRRLP